MSFGAPTPIEVAVSGPDFTKTRPFAQKLESALREISSLRDQEFEQELDYPAVKVDIDRRLAGMLGVTADQIGKSLTEATSSSRFTVPNFWADPKSGVGYQVQVEVPPNAWIRWNKSETSRSAGVKTSRSISATLPP